MDPCRFTGWGYNYSNDNIFLAVWRIGDLNNFPRLCQILQRRCKRFPLVDVKSQSRKESRLATIVWMGWIQQIIRNFFARNLGFICLWQFHWFRSCKLPALPKQVFSYSMTHNSLHFTVKILCLSPQNSVCSAGNVLAGIL